MSTREWVSPEKVTTCSRAARPPELISNLLKLRPFAAGIGSARSTAHRSAWLEKGKQTQRANKTRIDMVDESAANFGPCKVPSQEDFTREGGVTDGTRTRNSQNHNLELYH